MADTPINPCILMLYNFKATDRGFRKAWCLELPPQQEQSYIPDVKATSAYSTCKGLMAIMMMMMVFIAIIQWLGVA